MSWRELPEDLQSLMEKREGDERRQASDEPPQAERRSGADRRQEDGDA